LVPGVQAVRVRVRSLDRGANGGRIMIIEILFVVVMFLWLLTILPLPPMAPFASSNVFFAFVAVLLLGLFIFLPGIR
jgi:hypothetical protein